MKQKLYISLVLLSLPFLARAQYPVFDAVGLSETIKGAAADADHHIETIDKFVQQIQRMQRQVEQLEAMLDYEERFQSWTGNPIAAAQSMDIDQLRSIRLSKPLTRSENDIAKFINGLEALRYDGNNIVQPVYTRLSNGEEAEITPETFSTESHIYNRYDEMVANHDYWDAKRQELESEMDATLVQIQESLTINEREYLMAKMQALTAKLNGVSEARRQDMDFLQAAAIVQNNRKEVQAKMGGVIQIQEETKRFEGYAKSNPNFLWKN